PPSSILIHRTSLGPFFSLALLDNFRLGWSSLSGHGSNRFLLDARRDHSHQHDRGISQDVNLLAVNLQIADADVVADVEGADIDFDALRQVAGQAANLERVARDVQNPAGM